MLGSRVAMSTFLPHARSSSLQVGIALAASAEATGMDERASARDARWNARAIANSGDSHLKSHPMGLLRLVRLRGRVSLNCERACLILGKIPAFPGEALCALRTVLVRIRSSATSRAANSSSSSAE